MPPMAQNVDDVDSLMSDWRLDFFDCYDEEREGRGHEQQQLTIKRKNITKTDEVVLFCRVLCVSVQFSPHDGAVLSSAREDTPTASCTTSGTRQRQREESGGKQQNGTEKCDANSPLNEANKNTKPTPHKTNKHIIKYTIPPAPNNDAINMFVRTCAISRRRR